MTSRNMQNSGNKQKKKTKLFENESYKKHKGEQISQKTINRHKLQNLRNLMRMLFKEVEEKNLDIEVTGYINIFTIRFPKPKNRIITYNNKMFTLK